jgi:hypothetical protein
MEKWLVGCGAATSVVCRVFGHEASIAVGFYVRDRVRFSRTAQARDVLALLPAQGEKSKGRNNG